MRKPKPLTEEQLTLLESLIRSPVYGSLQAMIEEVRYEIHSQLTSESDPKQIYRLQGRLIGLGIVENLPRIHSERRELKRKREADKAEEEARKKRPPRRSL